MPQRVSAFSRGHHAIRAITNYECPLYTEWSSIWERLKEALNQVRNQVTTDVRGAEPPPDFFDVGHSDEARELLPNMLIAYWRFWEGRRKQIPLFWPLDINTAIGAPTQLLKPGKQPSTPRYCWERIQVCIFRCSVLKLFTSSIMYFLPLGLLSLTSYGGSMMEHKELWAWIVAGLPLPWRHRWRLTLVIPLGLAYGLIAQALYLSTLRLHLDMLHVSWIYNTFILMSISLYHNALIHFSCDHSTNQEGRSTSRPDNSGNFSLATKLKHETHGLMASRTANKCSRSSPCVDLPTRGPSATQQQVMR